MGNREAKPLYHQYFLCEEVLHQVVHLLPWRVTATTAQGPQEEKTDDITGAIRGIREIASPLEVDQEALLRLLDTHVRALAQGKTPTTELETMVRTYGGDLRTEVAQIPNTLDKARDALLGLIAAGGWKGADQTYDAMVLLSDAIDEATVAEVASGWKGEAQSHRKRHATTPSAYVGEIFWTSADFHEGIDGVSRYRFKERFGVGGFEGAFAEVEGLMASEVMAGSSQMESFVLPLMGETHLTAVGYSLWLVARSGYMTSALRDFVNIALRRIAGWQQTEGWWTDFQLKGPEPSIPTWDWSGGKWVEDEPKQLRYLPSTYTTALCSLALLKLAKSEALRRRGLRAAEWLLERQTSQGCWAVEEMAEDGVVGHEDVFCTLLCLECLARSGIPHVTHSIELGVKWIMEQQNELGMWDDAGFPFPFTTVLVLEFMGERHSYQARRGPFLAMAKGMLDRSVELSLEDDSNSCRLGVIAAFHGVEALLYEFLTHANIKIFEKPNETIGMRKALGLYQEYLQQQGELKKGDVIQYRNSVDRLAYLRDQVVHKGIDVSAAECLPLVGDALAFARRYCRATLGQNPWA